MEITDIEQYLELPYLQRDRQNYDSKTYTVIDRLYQSWDSCDCSKLTLLKILLIQQILKQRQHRNNKQKWYFGQYEQALETLINLNIDGSYNMKEQYKQYDGYRLD